MTLFSGGCSGDDGPVADSGAGSIMGVVTDYATGDPVANANVSLLPTGETTLTGSDGRFEFLNIKDGEYNLIISKAEYTELIDDYVIEVKEGKRVRRDIQIRKLPTFLQLTDMSGKDISSLNFEDDPSLTSKSFNIFNNGTVPVTCKIVYTCNWITSISSFPSTISPGATVAVAVTINRNSLSDGLNTTILTISTNNGSAELTITARSQGGNPPLLGISAPGSITETTATLRGEITNTFGGILSDCGFCYGTTPNPTTDDMTVRLGKSTSLLQHTITGLKAGTTYYCRAFATTNLGTGYSPEISFTTLSGLPICEETSISKIGSTTVKATSSVSSPYGHYVYENGFCWSTGDLEPSLDTNHIAASFGTGSFSCYIHPLQPTTIYRVRSYAKTEYGISYGPVSFFITQ